MDNIRHSIGIRCQVIDVFEQSFNDLRYKLQSEHFFNNSNECNAADSHASKQTGISMILLFTSAIQASSSFNDSSLHSTVLRLILLTRSSEEDLTLSNHLMQLIDVARIRLCQSLLSGVQLLVVDGIPLPVLGWFPP